MRNEIRDAATTTAADIAVSLISTLWEFADEELGLQLDADPTYGVRRVHKGEREHEPWSEELIDKFMLSARPSLRWAVRLALYTGQRRSDLVKMKWSQFDGEFIEVCQQKTDERLSIPCHRVLRAELETMPRRGETILVGDRGGPLTAASLSVMVRRTLRDMGVEGFSIHGLRKNAGKALAEAGAVRKKSWPFSATRPSRWSHIIPSGLTSGCWLGRQWTNWKEPKVANPRTQQVSWCG
jgi:integrase